MSRNCWNAIPPRRLRRATHPRIAQTRAFPRQTCPKRNSRGCSWPPPSGSLRRPNHSACGCTPAQWADLGTRHWNCVGSMPKRRIPLPPDFVDVPDRMLAADYDPDELLGISHAYAGQVALVDRCLGVLVDHLDESGLAATTQLTLLSARGYPLGEHLRVGRCDNALYNETVQIPWLMRFPDEMGRMARSQALVLPSDLPGTLLDWLELDRSSLATGCATSLLPIIRGEQASAARPCLHDFDERTGHSHAAPGSCGSRTMSRPSYSPNPPTAGKSTKRHACATTWSRACSKRWQHKSKQGPTPNCRRWPMSS